ncbi:MAG: citramalate synthase [Eubacteriales bacterium]|nr:citramalate synthase [Eubacteriales bacterium]
MKIDVLDTTLRDGVQSEDVTLSLEDKEECIRLFDELHLDFVEAGTPQSNPKDKKLLCETTPSLSFSRLVAFGTTRRKNSFTDTDGSLNMLAATNTPFVSIVGKSSVTQAEKILGVSSQENLKMIYDSIRFLCDRGKTVFFDAEHFFDGYKENADYALDCLRTAKNAGAALLVLCDTNGAGLPEEIAEITRIVVKTFRRVKIGVHCHDDEGLAVANTMAAVEAGATHIQGTFLGFGERCGNCNLITAILNLQLKKGYEILPPECVAKFTDTARRIAETVNVRLPNSAPYVGKSAFAHKGGLHGDGVMKYPPAFEHIDPAVVGNERSFPLSDVAGRAIFLKKAADVLPDVTLTDVQSETLLTNLKLLEMQGYRFEGADASFAVFVRKSLGVMPSFFGNGEYTVGTGTQHADGERSSATVSVNVDGEIKCESASGNGPVDALDNALRKVLSACYPEIDEVILTDYKVRVLNSEEATKAAVRVLITSSDGRGKSWSTVGVSTDVIDASWHALTDGYEYILSEKRSGKNV